MRRASSRRFPLLGAAAVTAAALLFGGCSGDDAPAGGGDSAPTSTSRTRADDPARRSAAGPARSQPRRSLEDATLGQLVGQRVIASFRQSGDRVPARLERRIRRGEVGGVILFSANGTTRAAVRKLTRRLQAIPRPEPFDVPLLVMVDQEGGDVRRLLDSPPRRSAAELAATESPALVRRVARVTGEALVSAGVNVALAPVADLARPGSVMEREERAFGGSPSRTGSFVAAFTEGLVSAGVQATAKHFPGLGAATSNSDYGPVTIPLDAEMLAREDRIPFRAAVAAGARLVMLSNAVYPELDPVLPASLSPRIVRLLRRELGFDGVAVTDDLEVRGLTPFGNVQQRALLAARAGVDLLIFGVSESGWEDALVTLRRAARRGELSRDELITAAARVLTLRSELEDGPIGG